MQRVFTSKDFETRDTLAGFDWSAVAGQAAAAGVSTGLQILAGLGNSGGGLPAKGLAAITSFVNQAVQALQQILAGVAAGQFTGDQALSDARRIAGYLSNPQYVYQAQRGNDAAVLQQGKAQAAALLAQIEQAAAVAPVPSGGAAGASAAAGMQGESSNLLMIGGLALAAVIFLLRQ
ncbi:MAG: hypothetical protein KF736_09900 [Acidobacteria bacterium]|nr:hypothetical protein [Acidobacteriota bacterium]MCW5949830.1 hypothetical protein [Pyrinomonadaceae bacterium]